MVVMDVRVYCHGYRFQKCFFLNKTNKYAFEIIQVVPKNA